jgi:hypothetical protein
VAASSGSSERSMKYVTSLSLKLPMCLNPVEGLKNEADTSIGSAAIPL